MTIPYVKQTWTDGSGGATPVSAARLAVMEQGIFDAQSPPAARVYNSALQTIPTATPTAITFDSEWFDTDTIHEAVTHPDRLTAKTAGVYLIFGSVRFAANNTGQRALNIILGATFGISGDNRTAVQGDVTDVSISTAWQLSVNDFVQLQVYQDSGGNLNVSQVNRSSPQFGMVRIA